MFIGDLYRVFLSGVFRLIFGRNWYIRHKAYDELEGIHHLLQDRLVYLYYVRRIGNLVQIKPPVGVVLLPSGDEFIFREIYLDEVYDKFYEIQKDDVVIDVGAHVGLFTLKAAKSGAKVVVAIEPHPFNYRILLRNITSNRLRNVIPINLAVSNYSGKAMLYISKHAREHTLKRELLDEYRGCIEVEVKTLDQLVDELKLSKVNFIKIDAEGAELDILRGAEKTLKENNVFLAIAAYHTPNEIYELSKHLRKMGFTVFSEKNMYVYAFK